MARVGLVFGEQDAHVAALQDALSQLGHTPVAIDASEVSEACRFSLTPDAERYNGLDCRALDAVFLRSILGTMPVLDGLGEVTLADLEERRQYAVERQQLVMSWLMRLQTHVRFVNPLEHAAMATLKPLQLAAIEAAGIRTPRTLTSNDPAEIAAFQDAVGETIFKPLAGGRYCERLGSAELTGIDWARHPAVFQELLPGENVRVTAVKGKILSACEVAGDAIDFRATEAFMYGQEAMREVDLPEETRRMCLRALEACGLYFSGIDLKRAADGALVVLECNRRPAWLHVENATGAPITEQLARFLARDVTSRSSRT